MISAYARLAGCSSWKKHLIVVMHPPRDSMFLIPTVVLSQFGSSKKTPRGDWTHKRLVGGNGSEGRGPWLERACLYFPSMLGY